MQKLLLLSVIFAAVAIPIRAANRVKNPEQGLKKALVNVILFNLFYVFALVFLYGRL